MQKAYLEFKAVEHSRMCIVYLYRVDQFGHFLIESRRFFFLNGEQLHGMVRDQLEKWQRRYGKIRNMISYDLLDRRKKCEK